VSKKDLDLKTTVNYAKEAYGELRTNTDSKVFTHCWSVARLAEQIAHKFFGDMRADMLPQDAPDIITAIVHASILHEIINFGRKTFENVAEIANVQVAAMVSTLSRDYRLVETKRDLEYRGRLSQSSISTHIVAVAEVICSAKEVIDSLNANGLAQLAKTRKILGQLDADLLVVHTAARYYVLRLYVHAARNLISDANQLIKKLKTEAKAAKAIERLTASVEAKLAIKTPVESHTSDSYPATKEKKRGKVRAAKKGVD
jgi:hypothetical protein